MAARAACTSSSLHGPGRGPWGRKSSCLLSATQQLGSEQAQEDASGCADADGCRTALPSARPRTPCPGGKAWGNLVRRPPCRALAPLPKGQPPQRQHLH